MSSRMLQCTKSHLCVTFIDQPGESHMSPKQSSAKGWDLRKTRYEPPVLEEAITAAQSLSDEIESQIEIAAQLMGMAADEVRPAVMRAVLQPPKAYLPSAPTRPTRRPQVPVVVVKRRSTR